MAWPSIPSYHARMKLLMFGLGFSALHVSQRLQASGARVTATVRSRAKADGLAQAGLTARVFSPDHVDEAIAEDIAACDAILVSIPPDESGDPVLASFADRIAAASKLRWVGYLSTVGVYGDHAGGWVDETTPLGAGKARSRNRVTAEQDWLAFGVAHDIAVHIFRLSGIYGPGRNQLAQLAAGTARRIIKPGQIFNRIHVADIAAAIDAGRNAMRSMMPRPERAYSMRSCAGDILRREWPATLHSLPKYSSANITAAPTLTTLNSDPKRASYSGTDPSTIASTSRMMTKMISWTKREPIE